MCESPVLAIVDPGLSVIRHKIFSLNQGSTLCAPQQFVAAIRDAVECWLGAGGLRWSPR